MNTLLIKKVHRWLGVATAIQLLIWTSSGLFFSIVPIEDIRGSHLIEKPGTFRLGHVRLVSPSSLVRQYKNELSRVGLDQVQMKQRLNTPVYLIRTSKKWLVFNAETAKKLMPLTENEAKRIATNITNLRVQSASWVETVEPGSEYREGELPAWKVELTGNVNLWIGANSGEVKAVRTSQWRIYDFLWSLHIMDYVDRDNFNSWLLRGFSLLGVITILSGIVLFISSTRWVKRVSPVSPQTEQ